LADNTGIVYQTILEEFTAQFMYNFGSGKNKFKKMIKNWQNLVLRFFNFFRLVTVVIID
jgi:hypothetical protein